MKEFYNNNRCLINLIFFNTLVFFAVYGLLIHTHFSSDSYIGYFDMNLNSALPNGRYIAFVIGSILDVFKTNFVKIQSVSTVIAITLFGVSTALHAFVFSDIIVYNKCKVAIVNIFVLIAFINVFLTEWFLFPEMMLLYGLAVLSVSFATLIIFKKQRKQSIVFSLFLLSIALNCYQAVLGFYVIFGLTYFVIKEKFIFSKSLVLKLVYILLIGFLASTLNVLLQFLSVQFFGIKGERVASLDLWHILNNLKEIAVVQKMILIDGMKLLPPLTILIFLLINIAILFLVLLNSKSKTKNILCLFLVILICYVIPFAPQIITPVFWPAPRTIATYFAVYTCLLLFILAMHKNALTKIATTSVFCFLILNVFQINLMIEDHLKINASDRLEASIIIEEIKKYEKNSNIEVLNIGIINDEFISYGLPNVSTTVYDLNCRAFSSPFSDIYILNMVSNRRFNKVEMDPQIYDTHFANKNWTYLDIAEQLVFIGNTLYLVKY